MADHGTSIALLRSTPAIDDFTRAGLSVRLERGLGMAKLRLFGPPSPIRFEAILGMPPPGALQQVEGHGLTCAWLAPGEWLMTGREANVEAWLAHAAAFDADDLIAVDLTHARTSLLVEGTDARTRLAAHCPLDLWSGAFRVDSAARSLLGDAGIFIARLADKADAPRFRIIVDQTLANYAARLLARD